MPEAILAQLNVSGGGMPKLPIDAARVTRDGVDGDWQTNRKYHGGPNRAVCIFSEENYAWLKKEFGIDLKNGSIGENFTTRGVDIDQWKKGDKFEVGECIIEVTDVRVPCRNLHQWDVRLMKLIKGRSGWVAKVMREGNVKIGDTIRAIG